MSQVRVLPREELRTGAAAGERADQQVQPIEEAVGEHRPNQRAARIDAANLLFQVCPNPIKRNRAASDSSRIGSHNLGAADQRQRRQKNPSLSFLGGALLRRR